VKRPRRSTTPSVDDLVVLAAKIIQKHQRRPDALTSAQGWRDFGEDLHFVLTSAGASEDQLHSFAHFLIDWIRSDHRLTTQQANARISAISEAFAINLGRP
jgi:hypothetical protein